MSSPVERVRSSYLSLLRISPLSPLCTELQPTLAHLRDLIAKEDGSPPERVQELYENYVRNFPGD